MLWGKTWTWKLPSGSRCDVPEPGESNTGESLNKQQAGRLLEKRYVYSLYLCKSSWSFQRPGYHLSVLEEHWLKTVLEGDFWLVFFFQFFIMQLSRRLQNEWPDLESTLAKVLVQSMQLLAKLCFKFSPPHELHLPPRLLETRNVTGIWSEHGTGDHASLQHNATGSRQPETPSHTSQL